jgi:hypothetical protein
VGIGIGTGQSAPIRHRALGPQRRDAEDHGGGGGSDGERRHAAVECGSVGNPRGELGMLGGDLAGVLGGSVRAERRRAC